MRRGPGGTPPGLFQTFQRRWNMKHAENVGAIGALFSLLGAALGGLYWVWSNDPRVFLSALILFVVFMVIYKAFNDD
jgi:hypothetical protein